MHRKTNPDGSQIWTLEKGEAEYVWCALQYFWKFTDKVKGIVRNSLMNDVADRLESQLYCMKNDIKPLQPIEAVLKETIAKLKGEAMENKPG